MRFSVLLMVTACGAPPAGGTVLGPSGVVPAVAWTAEERARDVALRTLRATEHASHHVARLAGAEKPHVHERSDLVVTVLSGKVKMHLGTAVTEVGPGSVIDVPRGVAHWAENARGAPSLAYVVAVPPLDPTDRRPVGAAP